MRKLTFRSIALSAAIFLGIFLGATISANAQLPAELSGAWQGTLDVSGMKLRLVFHLKQDSTGAWRAQMDSPDQGARGIPVSKVSFDKPILTLQVAAVRGEFVGEFMSGKKLIKGKWDQGGRQLPLDLQPIVDEKPAAPAETSAKPVLPKDAQVIAGNWIGALKISGIELRLVFKIKSDVKDGLTATIDSPDQGAKDIPTTSVAFSANKLKIEAKAINAVYKGKLDPQTGKISGTWTQSGRSLQLDLKKSKGSTELKRPQEPKKPYPYKEAEVEFKNESAGITLAGTLTKPEGDGPFPAVVLISGSGPQNRNEFLLGHKPFLVLADHLTRHGIAVLRYDDRGTAASTGTFATATTEDFATDAQAAVDYLRQRDDILPQEIGLIGHSEGGLIAPMVAAKSPDIAFIVLLAGPGLPGDQVLAAQNRLILKTMGASENMINEDAAVSDQIYKILKSPATGNEAADEIRTIWHDAVNASSDELKREFEEVTGTKLGENLEASIRQMVSPWFRFFLKYDPRPVLAKVKCPLLALNGEKDLQVPPDENLQAIGAVLHKAGHQNFITKKLPGLNHLFQSAETGAPSEYGRIEETMSPVALNAMSDWIAAHLQ